MHGQQTTKKKKPVVTFVKNTVHLFSYGEENKNSNFYVLLTVHPNIMIAFLYQLDAQILYFNTFFTFLYMFRALLCSSSRGQLY